MVIRKVAFQLPTEAASYPTRTEASAAPLHNFKGRTLRLTMYFVATNITVW